MIATGTGLRQALRDARATRRLHRAGREIHTRYWQQRQDQRPQATKGATRSWGNHLYGLAWLFGLPMLAPLFVSLAGDAETHWLHFLACLCVLAIGGREASRSLLRFSSTEILRFPSKAGVFLVRFLKLAPLLLWIGACWAAAVAFKLEGLLRADPLAGGALLLAVVLVPVLWSIGRAHRQLTVGDESVVGPLVVLGLAGSGLWFLWRDPVLDTRHILLSILLGLLAAGSLIGMTVSWLRQPRQQLQAAWVDLLTTPRWIVAIGLLLPAKVWAAVPLGLLGPGFLAVVLAVLPAAVWRLVPRLLYAEEKPRPVGMVRSADELEPRERTAAAPPMPSHHRGRRGLTRAMLFEHRCRSFPRRGELRDPNALLGTVFVLVYHIWGPLLATLAVALTGPSHVQVLLPILAALTAPRFVRTQSPCHRIWLLGVSYRQQALHNLRATLLLAAVPALLAATVTGFVTGWSVERAGVLALMAGLLACRAGLPGLLGDGEFHAPGHRGRVRSLAVFAVLLALVALPHLVPRLPGSWLLWAGSGLLATGGLGLGLRLGRLQEARLVRELCRTHEDLRSA